MRGHLRVVRNLLKLGSAQIAMRPISVVSHHDESAIHANYNAAMDAPGEKLLIRLWDTLEKVLGGLLSPWQVRRLGQAGAAAQRDEMLALAQAERDIEDIRSGRKVFTADWQLVDASSHRIERSSPEASKLVTLASTAQSKLVLREIRGDRNVGAAVSHAEANLRNDPQEPPERTVDEDWLYRWRDSASDVSEEELQALWGRVLAGEVKSPGTFSLRTLQFLKNLSKEEARQIEKLAPFVVDDDFVFKGGDLLEKAGISLGFLLGLQDLGIVQAQVLKKPWTSVSAEEFKQGLIAYTRVLVVTHSDPSKKLALRGYRLTSLGKQVLKIGSFIPCESYVRSIGRAICDLEFKVVIAQWEWVTETEGRYFNVEDL